MIAISLRKPLLARAVCSLAALPMLFAEIRTAFAQSYVGRNGDSESKLHDFAQRMEVAGLSSVAIAFVKGCCVDVVATTRKDKLFALYKETVAKLEQMLPRMKFVSVTVRLSVRLAGLKARVKWLLGMLSDDNSNNRSRQAFNDLLDAEYRGNCPLFDVAAVKSTLTDGKEVTCGIGRDGFQCLAAHYATDGGSLNEARRLLVARELLFQLEEVAR
jgi:hypothetical protein